MFTTFITRTATVAAVALLALGQQAGATTEPPTTDPPAETVTTTEPPVVVDTTTTTTVPVVEVGTPPVPPVIITGSAPVLIGTPTGDILLDDPCIPDDRDPTRGTTFKYLFVCTPAVAALVWNYSGVVIPEPQPGDMPIVTTAPPSHDLDQLWLDMIDGWMDDVADWLTF